MTSVEFTRKVRGQDYDGDDQPAAEMIAFEVTVVVVIIGILVYLLWQEKNTTTATAVEGAAQVEGAAKVEGVTNVKGAVKVEVGMQT